MLGTGRLRRRNLRCWVCYHHHHHHQQLAIIHHSFWSSMTTIDRTQTQRKPTFTSPPKQPNQPMTGAARRRRRHLRPRPHLQIGVVESRGRRTRRLRQEEKVSLADWFGLVRLVTEGCCFFNVLVPMWHESSLLTLFLQGMWRHCFSCFVFSIPPHHHPFSFDWSTTL